MRPILRRLVLAILAVSLTSQLAHGQLLSCTTTQMNSSEMPEAMSAMDHQGHDLSGASFTSTDAETRTDGAGSPTCIIPAGCANAPGIPIVPDTACTQLEPNPTITSAAAFAASASVRPALPPPRA